MQAYNLAIYKKDLPLPSKQQASKEAVRPLQLVLISEYEKESDSSMQSVNSKRS